LPSNIFERRFKHRSSDSEDFDLSDELERPLISVISLGWLDDSAELPSESFLVEEEVEEFRTS